LKPFDGLSCLGRTRRLRRLAQAALDSYGLSDPRLLFLRHAGNTLYRVIEPRPAPAIDPGLFVPGRYLLRVHEPGYQSPEAIRLALAWLAAMRHDAGLPVPEPVPPRDGDLLAQVEVRGVPEARTCSLLRWVRGRAIDPSLARPQHFLAQGQLMARLHDHASRWQPPAGLDKRKYDWEGLFREDSGAGIPAGEAWARLPPQYVASFETVAASVRQVMDAWGKGPEVYGLIHADLGLDASVLFHAGDARAIDFDDSGFGNYPYDLSLALEHCQEDPALPRYRDALLDGYCRVRPLPADQVGQLDLFLASFCVYLSLWAAATARRLPQHREALAERMARAFRLVESLLSNG
jgi:Ser/Thr protein kinase RdoA (MazF antagonist)